MKFLTTPPALLGETATYDGIRATPPPRKLQEKQNGERY